MHHVMWRHDNLSSLMLTPYTSSILYGDYSVRLATHFMQMLEIHSNILRHSATRCNTATHSNIVVGVQTAPIHHMSMDNKAENIAMCYRVLPWVSFFWLTSFHRHFSHRLAMAIGENGTWVKLPSQNPWNLFFSILNRIFIRIELRRRRDR